MSNPRKSLTDTPSKSVVDTPSKSVLDKPRKSLLDTPRKSLLDTPRKSLLDTPRKSLTGISSKSLVDTPSKSLVDPTTGRRKSRALIEAEEGLFPAPSSLARKSRPSLKATDPPPTLPPEPPSDPEAEEDTESAAPSQSTTKTTKSKKSKKGKKGKKSKKSKKKKKKKKKVPEPLPDCVCPPDDEINLDEPSIAPSDATTTKSKKSKKGKKKGKKGKKSKKSKSKSKSKKKKKKGKKKKKKKKKKGAVRDCEKICRDAARARRDARNAERARKRAEADYKLRIPDIPQLTEPNPDIAKLAKDPEFVAMLEELVTEWEKKIEDVLNDPDIPEEERFGILAALHEQLQSPTVQNAIKVLEAAGSAALPGFLHQVQELEKALDEFRLDIPSIPELDVDNPDFEALAKDADFVAMLEELVSGWEKKIEHILNEVLPTVAEKDQYALLAGIRDQLESRTVRNAIQVLEAAGSDVLPGFEFQRDELYNILRGLAPDSDKLRIPFIPELQGKTINYAKLAKNKGLVAMLEGLVREWEDTIENVLNEEMPEGLTLEEEQEWWRKHNAKLTALKEQLDSKEARRILKLLETAQSDVLAGFEMKVADLEAALQETKDKFKIRIPEIPEFQVENPNIDELAENKDFVNMLEGLVQEWEKDIEKMLTEELPKVPERERYALLAALHDQLQSKEVRLAVEVLTAAGSEFLAGFLKQEEELEKLLQHWKLDIPEIPEFAVDDPDIEELAKDPEFVAMLEGLVSGWEQKIEELMNEDLPERDRIAMLSALWDQLQSNKNVRLALKVLEAAGSPVLASFLEKEAQLKKLLEDLREAEREKWENDEYIEEPEVLSEGELEYRRGKALRDKRRAERPEPQNVDGAIPIDVLRTFTNAELEELIAATRKDIQLLKTENYLYERTIERLEEPEKIVEELFASKTASDASSLTHGQTNAAAVCSSEEETESEDEPEGDEEPDYSPVIPIEEIDPSNDSFFDNMSDNTKEASLNYFRNVGIIAPPKYDVMRHKYGKYVKGAKESESYAKQEGAGVAKATRLKSSIYKAGTALIEEKIKKTKIVDATTRKVVTMFDHWMGEDENEFIVELDYPDFDVSDVKQLRLEDKLKFALQEEEQFRRKVYMAETRTLKAEGALDVNIDVHQHSVRVLLELCKDFEMIASDTVHPLKAKAMSDMILRLTRKMRNKISGEETKTRMAIREILAIRRRVAHQLRCAKRTGFNVNEIDFEHLIAENEIYHNEMDEMNVYLKYLKQQSNNFFHIMDEDQDETRGLVEQEDAILATIKKRRAMLAGFKRTYQKYKVLILKTRARLRELKHKLQAYHAPKPMEYMRLKSSQYDIEAEMRLLTKRLEDLTLKLFQARASFAKLCKKLPRGDETELENEAWLASVHTEVEAGDLLSALESDSDEEDLPPSLRVHQPHRADKRDHARAPSLVDDDEDTPHPLSGQYPLLSGITTKPAKGISGLGEKEKRKIASAAAAKAAQTGVGRVLGGDETIKRKSRVRAKTAHTILLETPVKAGMHVAKPVIYDMDADFQARMEYGN